MNIDFDPAVNPIADYAVYSQIEAMDSSASSFRVMSYNVRVDHLEDRDNENRWDRRKAKIEWMINRYAPDVLALQEPSLSQVEDLRRTFGHKYAVTHFVVNPAAYKDANVYKSEQHRETQAIFYRYDRFEKIISGGFWLSESPDELPEASSWDSSPYLRGANYATLKDKITDRTITVLNAHFDHQGIIARMRSAQLMMQKARELAPDHAALVLGDFNTFQPRDVDPVYKVFEEHFDRFSDIRDAAGGNIFGVDGSWIGWEYNACNERRLGRVGQERYDQFFVDKMGLTVLWTAIPNDCFRIIWDRFSKDVYPSDHRPIVGAFEFSN